MTYRRDLPAHGAQGTPGQFAAWDMLETWFDAKNKVTAQLEDRQFGPLPATGADWGPRFNQIINEIEQTGGVTGGAIECYPEEKKISTTVNAFTAKKCIVISSPMKGRSGIFSGRGYGAGFYAGVSGMTMFHHGPPNPTGSLNHWGPYFSGISFSGGNSDQGDPGVTTANLVLIETANYWGFEHCAFVNGNVQLKVDDRGDVNSGYDASYGDINDCVFSHYNSIGFHLVSGMCNAKTMSWHQGATNSWGMRIDANAAQASFTGLKFDTPAGGLWTKGHVMRFNGVSIEGPLVGLRLDKDPAVAWSGQGNEFFGLSTTLRGVAGDTGVDVTTNVTGINSIYGYRPWGAPGTGGAFVRDPNGRLLIVASEWTDDGGPVVKLPDRSVAPPTPTAGSWLYSRAGVMRTKGTDGVERQIGN